VAANRPAFLEELTRRHVWRVAIAYAVVAWLLLQVASVVLPTFGTPAWMLKALIVLFVLCFPVALILAWAFELTPEGVRRTESSDSPEARPAHAHRSAGQKINAVIIVVLVMAVALMGWRLYADHHPLAAPQFAARTAPAPASMAGAAMPGSRAAVNSAAPGSGASVSEKSVAVLPFANESGNKDERFFSDGLSDDLTNALSQFEGLKVISRNSAFQFRDSNDSSAVIGQKLGVAHLLEGSVQHAGDEVRITATLVSAADGSIIWSQRYDKPYKDLFALQDAITNAVAGALKAKLLTAPGAVVQSDRPPSGNLDAYAAYLRGLGGYKVLTPQAFRDAIAAFGEAIRLDPHYAAAYAQLSRMWTGLAAQFLSGSKAKQAYAEAAHAASTALALDPDLALAHLARANLLLTSDMNWKGAEAEAQRAVRLSPNDAYARFFLAGTLAPLGQTRRAVELVRQALQADPRHVNWYLWMSTYLSAQDRLDEAAEAVGTAIALQPGATGFHEQLTLIGILRGDARAALAAAQQEPDATYREIALTLAYQIGSDHAAADAALKKLIADHGDNAAYQIAQVYALRRDPDNTFKWLDRAWTSRDAGINYLLFDPLILRYRDDPRFAAFCKKVGLPTSTDAVAMR